MSDVSLSLPPLRMEARANQLRVMLAVHHLDIGGTERLVRDLALHYQKEMDVSVCCLDRPGHWAESLQQAGVPVLCLERRAGLDLRAVWRLAAEMRRRRVGILHCHQYPAFFYGALASAIAPGTRVLFTEHGRHYPDYVSRRRRLANRLLMHRLAPSISSVSYAVKEALAEREAFPASRIEVIPNGIETELYRYTAVEAGERRQSLGFDSSHFVIGTVGRLDPVKDQECLLRAFAKLVRQVPQARLLVAGDGPARTALEQLTDELGIRSAVNFLGFRQDIAEILSACDVFALTSRMESMPVSILEAMASDLPVVATSVGDIPRIVADGVSGFLCPAGDWERIAERLLELIRDRDRRKAMGAEGRKIVGSQFTLERMLKRYREVYERLAGG